MHPQPQQFEGAELQFAYHRPWWVFLACYFFFQEGKVMHKTTKYTEEMR